MASRKDNIWDTSNTAFTTSNRSVGKISAITGDLGDNDNHCQQKNTVTSEVMNSSERNTKNVSNVSFVNSDSQQHANFNSVPSIQSTSNMTYNNQRDIGYNRVETRHKPHCDVGSYIVICLTVAVLIAVAGGIATVILILTFKGSNGCSGYEEVARCETNVGIIRDLSVEPSGSILASGREGLARCSKNGGMAELIQLPNIGETYTAAAVSTPDGQLWTILNFDLYAKNSSAEWHEMNTSRISYPHALIRSKDNLIIVLDGTLSGQRLHWINPGFQLNITKTIYLPNITTWNYTWDLAELPSGDIAVSDYHGHCVHVISRDGQLLATLGVPGQSGSAPDLLENPTELSVDESGNILVDDQGVGLELFDKDGKFIQSICPNMVVFAHTMSNDGELIVSNSINDVIIMRKKS